MAIGWAANNTSAPSGPAGGDLDGTFPNPTVDGLQGEPVSDDEPTAGDVLTYTAGEWTPSAPTGGAPSGAASGDLGGTYPSPTVAKIQTTPVSAVAPTAGQMLRESGGTWTPTTVGAADVGADPTGTAAAAIVTHVGLADPHTQYATEVNAALSGTATSATTPANSDATTAIANTQFVANAFDPARMFRVFDHFLSGQTFGSEGWSLATNGAGAIANPNPVVVSGARGFYRLNAGTNAANGRSALSFEQAVSQLPLVQPWLTGPVVLEWRTQLALLPVLGVSEYQVGMSLGQGAATALTTFFNGVGFTFDITVSANWRFSSRTAGVEVAGVDTGVAVVAAAWRYYRIEVDGVSARAYIGATKAAAVLVATIAIASVTASVALGPLTKTYNAGIGTLATRHVDIDYIKVDGTITTPT